MQSGAGQNCTNTRNAPLADQGPLSQTMTHFQITDYRVRHPLRVRWSEVDIQRIVFNPHYLTYVDIAFTEYWRALAIPYEMIPGLLGGDLYVKKSTLEYHGSARLDDRLDIAIRCNRIGNSSLAFSGGVFRDTGLLVSADLVYVFADPATQTARPVPAQLRDLITDFEAGKIVLDVVQGSWSDIGSACRGLRKTVFMDELQIAAALDEDAQDQTAVHILIRNRLGQALATGRLLHDGNTSGSLGRVAVLRSMRGAGLGKMVVNELVRHADAAGVRQLKLAARADTQALYAGLGFQPLGEVYLESGTVHVAMQRGLG